MLPAFHPDAQGKGLGFLVTVLVFPWPSRFRMATEGNFHSRTLAPLPGDHRIGLIVASFFGFISLLSTTALFLHLTVRLVWWKLAKPPDAEHAEDARSLTRDAAAAADQFFAPPPVSDEEMRLRRSRARGKTSPNQLLFLVYNLLLADMQQSLAHILSVAWIRWDGIFVGTSM